jgi:hypothetical protein
VENIKIDHLDIKKGLTHIMTFTAVESKIYLRSFKIVMKENEVSNINLRINFLKWRILVLTVI